jgi:hypothetical protein
MQWWIAHLYELPEVAEKQGKIQWIEGNLELSIMSSPMAREPHSRWSWLEPTDMTWLSFFLWLKRFRPLEASKVDPWEGPESFTETADMIRSLTERG